MVHYTHLGLEQMFPAPASFSTWLGDKRTVIAMAIVLLLIIGIVLFLRSKHQSELEAKMNTNKAIAKN